MDLDEALYEARRTFSPPRELGSAPRAVRLTAGGWLVVIGAVALFAGAVIVGVLMQREVSRQAADRLMFAERGVTTDAEVTRVWRAGSSDSKRYWIAYRFDVDTRPYEGETRVSQSLSRSLQAGALVTIKYLRDDPTRSTLASGPAGALPVWLPYLVGAMIVSGGLLVVWMVMRQRSLLIEGRAAPAVVTDVVVRKTGHGSHRSIRYKFPVMSGAIATGKSDASRKPPAVGTVLCIVYMPDEPNRSAPYPLALVRPVDVSAR